MMKKSKYFISFLISMIILLSCFVTPSFAAAVKGDVNGDGDVTTDDAMAALKIAAGINKATADQLKTADMNGDGSITIPDVYDILKEALGIGEIEVSDYEQSLLDAGFPKSYVADLLALHEKYPKWKFKAFNTGLTFSEAVAGERTPHNQQVIDISANSDMKCACSSCNGVLQEGSRWVSASKKAVEYYLDPRNFLNERYIFQFEDTTYSSSHNISGIETIIKNTWMHNAYITYYDTSGNLVYYTKNGSKVTYSEAIMEAAKASGMSAYYLASKIVQEVGSSTSSYATGTRGTASPYNGIYNYYSIGAYTGAYDGLSWANGYMKSNKECTLYKSNSTSSNALAIVPASTTLYWKANSGSFYKVGVSVGGSIVTGYVLSSAVSISTTYGRPWSNPYQSIYYGAQWISERYSKQFTGYLQKFNVNSASSELFGHEYMTNVEGAASEATSSYRAYSEAGLLATEKIFSIPVFKNMPNDEATSDQVKAFKPVMSCPKYDTNSVTLSWTGLSGVTGYKLYKYDPSTSSYSLLKNTTSLSYTDPSLSTAKSYKYKVVAYLSASSTTVYSAYSAVLTVSTAPYAVDDLKVDSKTNTSVKLSWSKPGTCNGYAVYRYDSVSAKYTLLAKITATSYTDSTAKSGTNYKYRVRSYINCGSLRFYSAVSNTVSVKTSGTVQQQRGTVRVSPSLNVRSGPGTNYEKIDSLYDGNSVVILSRTNDWYYVSYTKSGVAHKGYVSAEYIVLN